jgi:trk system potassium uptake protein TrkH
MEHLRNMTKKLGQHMTASQMMGAGFALIIFLGGLVLSLPVCNADGKWLNFVDALFTSCTAVCVTGLVTIVPAVQFSLLGKVVLLLLIQVGGFGVIVCMMGVLLILRRQITIRSRVMIQESFNLNKLSGIVRMLLYVLKGTFLVEGIGALLYACWFVPHYGFFRGIWYAVFHAVSAFCNAGIDILGDDSLQMFVTNPLINLVTVGLIVVSGIGFLVWQDLSRTIGRIYRREMRISRALQKMQLQTKLAVLATLVLVFGGTLVILALEYDNPDTLGALHGGQKVLAALFQSVTTRTAGFFTIPQNLFREETKLFSCVLMFIGGCPGGTAGGVKTTTILVLLLTCVSILRGKEDTECFHRKIPAVNIRTALSVFLVGILTVLLGTMLLLVTEHTTLMTALYETVSAVCTVGLTQGLTPLLSVMGKLLIIFLMYMGRIGPVTLVLFFAGKSSAHANRRTLPEERIMVG